MKIWTTAWRTMTWLDWAFVAVMFTLLFLPTLGAAVPPGSVNVPHPGIETVTFWPNVRPITLNPEISLGNLVTMFGMVVWVARWGAKTITVVNEVPVKLSIINKRLRRLELTGCSQFEQHREAMRRIERSQDRQERSHAIPDEDLKGEGCLK